MSSRRIFLRNLRARARVGAMQKTKRIYIPKEIKLVDIDGKETGKIVKFSDFVDRNFCNSPYFAQLGHKGIKMANQIAKAAKAGDTIGHCDIEAAELEHLIKLCGAFDVKDPVSAHLLRQFEPFLDAIAEAKDTAIEISGRYEAGNGAAIGGVNVA